MDDRQEFLIQRWEVPVPEAPDGLAIIGPNPDGSGFLQHYFDSRGVARIYRMTFEDGKWILGVTQLTSHRSTFSNGSRAL